ncbi:MAG: hypothetical protein KDD11_05530 [Acidobacteria bacterium]|nr:hypothetical protein [Acidobacteriota bacterium]
MRYRRAMARKPHEPAEDVGSERHTLALPHLFDSLRRAGDHRVLDLGPAAGTNLETFSQLGCRLHVADLYRGLAGSGATPADDAGRWHDTFAALLPSPGAGEPFDAILAWDLLDYLGRRQRKALMDLVLPLCRPGALFFCMVSIRAAIPARPLAYRIVAPDRLMAGGDPDPVRPGPKLHQPDLLRAMPGFRVFKSFLLRHGVQEYLLVSDTLDESETA